MTSLPKTARGHDAITVFVDRLSKYVHIIPTKMTITAIQFATIFRDDPIFIYNKDDFLYNKESKKLI
jgi:hypothetical protein